MKSFLGLLSTLLLTLPVTGQVRYLDEVFQQVERREDIVYGRNISVLTGSPTEVDLLMDVYVPVEAAPPERPVVIYLHGGWFLPQIYNGDIIGTRRDSSVVEICTRLARMGYTAVAATYRKGWSPLASELLNRHRTLLPAIYRSIQDARTCVRYLRRTYVEEGNPFGIDPDRMVLWGEESGGLISLNAGFLDHYEELLLPAFFDPETGGSFIQPGIHGDPYGLEAAELNLVNHPGYSSDVQMVVGMGGAVLHPSWIDEDQPGYPERPQVVGFHVPVDPHIPYGIEIGLFPSAIPPPLFISQTGSRFVLELANEMGFNDRLAPVLAVGDPLTQYVNDLQEETWWDPYNFEAYPLATDHLYPFLTPNGQLEKAPWVWWGVNDLEGYLENFVQIDPSEFIATQELRYPDMSPEKARAYIDTIIAYTAPRACASLCLVDCLAAMGAEASCLTSREEREEVKGPRIFPQPATEQLTVAVEEGQLLESIQVFDLQGRLLAEFRSLFRPSFVLERGGLPAGLYLMKIKTDRTQVVLRHFWR